MRLMISFAQPLPIGNAVRVSFAPPEGAILTRILRKVADDFTGFDDAAALVVYQGRDTYVLDTTTLVNGTPYYYREYDSPDGLAWSDGGLPSASATPAATAVDASVDVLEIVRSRLEAGLRVEVENGALTNVNGYIPCLTAPPLTDNVQFPVVTCHVRNDAPSARALAESIGDAVFDPVSGQWTDGEGWLSAWQIDIIGWDSGNPDGRIALRKAIKKVIIGNLPVFEAAGISLPVYSASDTEDFDSYATPMYQAVGSFTCLAASAIASNFAAISDVQVIGLAA